MVSSALPSCIPSNSNIASFLVFSNLAKSKSDAKRLVRQGGVHKIEIDGSTIYRVGRHFVRIEVWITDVAESWNKIWRFNDSCYILCVGEQ